MSEKYSTEGSKVDALKRNLPLYGRTYDKELFTGLMRRLSQDSSLPEPAFAKNKNSLSVLDMRYFRKDAAGVPQENSRGLLYRVSSFVALPEFAYSGGDENRTYEVARRFYSLMANSEFMPNSPTLMNAGRSMGMLSGCFVIPIEDSIESIMDAAKITALVQKAGGGTGFSFDNLRPTGDYINSSGGTTSGPISFWRVLAETTNAIQQGAFRRGANMGMMSTHRPDILRFINAKAVDGQFANFNISTKIENNWMNDFLSNPDSPLVVSNPRTGQNYFIPRDVNIDQYDVQDLVSADKSGVDLSKMYTKRMLWNIIVENAHRNGDPGIAFIDKMNEGNPTPKLGRIDTTNPCGEQPLLAYEACNLGSINLGLMIKEGKPDYERLREVTRGAVRFLDNVIDVNTFPDSRIIERVSGNRKIGLGVMGWADMLASLRIRYDSEQAIKLAEEVMGTIQQEAVGESERLALERGAFPNFDQSIYAGGRLRRNAAVTTIAPTGTISIIAGASGGIEPFFGNAYSHRDSEGNIRKFTNDVLRRDLVAAGVDADMVFKRLFEGATLKEIKEVPREIADTYVTSHELSIESQLSMQAAFQRHTENAVSKTINLCENATVEDVDRAYRTSYLCGCKGVTVYRNGSRGNQPIIFGKVPELIEKPKRKILVGTHEKPMVVPEIMPAVRIRQDTPFGHIHTSIIFDSANDYKAVEVFGLLGNAGTEEAATLEGFGRAASLHLRTGGSLETMVDQWIGIGSGAEKATRSGQVRSLAMGLGKSLLKFVVARRYFKMEDLLLGKVDYDQFSGQVADVVKRFSDDPESLLKEGGFKRVQDFLAEVGVNPSKTEAPVYKNGKKSAYTEKCPHCKGPLIHEEGCMKCHTDGCGFSKC